MAPNAATFIIGRLLQGLGGGIDTVVLYVLIAQRIPETLRPIMFGRLVLGDQDLVLTPGEAAEFDTHIPHWVNTAANASAELLILFGHQGERAHLRVKG